MSDAALSSIQRLAKALRAVDRELDWRDLADIVWLLHQEAPELGEDTNEREGATSGTPATARVIDHVASAPSNHPRMARAHGDRGPTDEESSPAPRVRGERDSRRSSLDRLGVAAPHRFALPRRREIERALKPLRRRFRTARRRELDVAATVDHFCDTGIMAPVLRRAKEPWLDATLVVDRGPSMEIWRDAADEFANLVERSGVFRNVRRWTVDTRHEPPTLSPDVARRRTSHRADELIDPSGRRLIILLSDGIAPAWKQRGAWSALKTWGRWSSTVIIRPLAESVAPRTPLGAGNIRVSAPWAAAPTSHLLKKRPWWFNTAVNDVVPLVPFTPAAIGRWARFVAGAAGSTLAAASPAIRAGSPAHSRTGITDERLRDVINTGLSANAHRLGVLLSATSTSVDVARILMERMLPETDLANLGELLALGVLTFEDDRLVFAGRAGEVFRGMLTSTDALRVWLTVSPYLERVNPEAAPFVVLDAVPGITATPEAAAIVKQLANRFGFASTSESRRHGAPAKAQSGVGTPDSTELGKAVVRWLNVEVDNGGQPLRVAQHYTVAVFFGERSETAPAPVPATRRFAGISESIDLSVTLVSSDFDTPPRPQTLTVGGDGRSKGRALFECTPLHDGSSTISVLVDVAGNFLQRLEVTFDVGSSSEPLITNFGRPVDAAKVAEHRTAVIQCMPAVGGYELFVKGVTDEQVFVQVTEHELAERIDDVRRAILTIVKTPTFALEIDIPDDLRAAALTELAWAGFRLYSAIFAGPFASEELMKVGAWLRESLSDEVVTLQIVSRGFPVPWALMYLTDRFDPAKLDWSNFIGMRHVIEQIPLREIPAMPPATTIASTPDLSVRVLFNEGIEAQIPSKPISAQRTYWAGRGVALAEGTRVEDLVKSALATTASDKVLYLYCHAVASNKDSDDSYLVLTGNERITLGELRVYAPIDDKLESHPLVVINACESGDLTPRFYEEFVPYFLAKGARGVIGTEWKTPGRFASEWAIAFFDRFFSGERLGEAVLGIRRDFLTKHGNPLGLLYGVYCDTDTVVAPALKPPLTDRERNRGPDLGRGSGIRERSYRDFDLLLEESIGAGYRARVIGSPAGETESVAIELPFTEQDIEIFLLRIGRQRRGAPSDEAHSSLSSTIEEFGAELFDAVFRDQIRDAFMTSIGIAEADDAGLRIRLRFARAAELANFPWEFLHDRGTRRFLALSDRTSLVRHVELPGRTRPLPVTPPLRILLMAVSPVDFDAPDAAGEKARLREVLADLVAANRVVLEEERSGTLAGLQRQLRIGEYQVFHLIAPGGFDETQNDDVLYFEGPGGRGQAVTGHALGDVLSGHRSLLLAVLNAGEGAGSGRERTFASTAESLVRRGIPAVIAMQFEITDEAAVTFAHSFYEAVSDGYPLETSMTEARKSIRNMPNLVEWATPALHMRADDGVNLHDRRDPAPPGAAERM